MKASFGKSGFSIKSDGAVEMDSGSANFTSFVDLKKGLIFPDGSVQVKAAGKIDGGVPGNSVGMDSEGNLVDSGQNIQQMIDELKQYVDLALAKNDPIGSYLIWSTNQAPENYMRCDGTLLSVADYPELYAVIGNIYGGDSTHFNLPDARDRTLWGSENVGVYSNGAVPNVVSTIYITASHQNSGADGGVYRTQLSSVGGGLGGNSYNSNGIGTSSYTFSPAIGSGIYQNTDHVTAKHVTANICMKVK